MILALRATLTGILLYYVYHETGIATALALGLIVMAFEAVMIVLTAHNKIMKSLLKTLDGSPTVDSEIAKVIKEIVEKERS
jgi:NhaP-type Na+/H+ or K+/H+ antiporter